MNGFDEFINFCMKYKGAILGALIAIVLVFTGILDALIIIGIVILGMILGNYVQRNKEIVKEKLKNFIDKFEEDNMQRSAMRELAFQLIYGIEIQKDITEDVLQLFFENNNVVEEEVQDYLEEIQTGIKTHEEEINELISHNLKKNWSLNRISKINLSLIKIAIYEMVYLELPYKIAINEVVELAKKYADDSAPVFINGILASVVKEKNLNGETNEN